MDRTTGMNLKRVMLNEGSQSQMTTYCILPFRGPPGDGKTIGTENRLMIVRGWGCKKGLITKGHKEPFRGMELFCISILAMAPWLGTLVKTYETVRNKGWIWLQINYTSIKTPYIYTSFMNRAFTVIVWFGCHDDPAAIRPAYSFFQPTVSREVPALCNSASSSLFTPNVASQPTVPLKLFLPGSLVTSSFAQAHSWFSALTSLTVFTTWHCG